MAVPEPDLKYDVHPSVGMVQGWVRLLPEKTGRSLEEWIDLVKESGPATNLERREWLKYEHKLPTNSAAWIVEYCEGQGGEDRDPDSYLVAAADWVDTMFSGKKAALRVIYNELLHVCKNLGPDIRICPCKTIVPIYRHHVIAQIKPTTNTRIDFGLALHKTPASGRLIDTGGFAKKDRITHRMPISGVDQIDDEVRSWLKAAYDLDNED